MMINNPVYTLRLIDLVDMQSYPFDFSEIYKKVGDMLEPIKASYYTNDNKEWKKFVERLCRRFYNRNLNFDTYLDFTIKLQDVLDSKRMIADRYVILNAQKINPFTTYGMIKDSNGNTNDTIDTNSNSDSTSTSKSDNKTTNDSKTRINDSGTINTTDTNKVNQLHSDTPATSVSIDNLFTNNNYVTDANSQKSDSTQKVSDNRKNETASDSTQTSSDNSSNKITSNSDSNTQKNSTNIYKEISEGYQGNPIELLDRIDKLTTDVIEKYMLWIEESHLFSGVFY